MKRWLLLTVLLSSQPLLADSNLPPAYWAYRQLPNAEQERQTRVDTTVGADRPIGARGARAADGVAEGPGRTV